VGRPRRAAAAARQRPARGRPRRLRFAADAEDFRTRAANFFRGKGFEVASFEAVELLEDRDLAGVLPEEMRRLGELAGETSQVQFDTYFTYGSTDE
jgi:maleate cis-trans isomerase